MNIYTHELRAYRKSTIIWTISLVALVILFMSIFPAFSKDAEEFKKLLEGYPEPVRKAIGLNLESFTSLLGFYSYVFLYFSLCGAIQAMNIGTSILSKEVREKTADFLLTKPVSRSKIITSKILAGVTSIVITNICFLIAVNFMASYVKNESYDQETFLMISITLLFIQLIFLSIGTFVSVIVSKIKSVIAVSLGTVFTFFIIGMLASTSDDEKLRYISPFKYFDSAYIIKHSSYETPFVVLAILIVGAAISAGYIIYIKKDIHTV
ncbi:MAG: putative type transport system permease protein [Bacillales bacterium]|nr:putative type transport system permease protein [Bacillales bacterium]